MDLGELGYPFSRSPNQSGRNGVVPSATVIHYTAGGSAAGSIDWLCNLLSMASAHFVISRQGNVTQLVSLERKAWHAGVSEILVDGEMVADASPHTIGIELANHGVLQIIDGLLHYELGSTMKLYRRTLPVHARLEYDNGMLVEGWWEPYPDEQIDALQELLVKVAAAGYGEAAQNLIGHEEIGMPLGRKTDPGSLFPWERFRRKMAKRTVSMLLDDHQTSTATP